MVERRICSFCGQEIEPGTGRIHVRKDGTVFQFCTSKCYKNMIELKRVPRRTAWTAQFFREKEAKLRTMAHQAEEAKLEGEEGPPEEPQESLEEEPEIEEPEEPEIEEPEEEKKE
jgi:large subunit ribosomal protein L24e